MSVENICCFHIYGIGTEISFWMILGVIYNIAKYGVKFLVKKVSIYPKIDNYFIVNGLFIKRTSDDYSNRS